MKKTILFLFPILSSFFLLSVSNVFADSQTINFESPTYSTAILMDKMDGSKQGHMMHQ